MEIAVLLKAVPDAETIRFDAERRTVVRASGELLANPFDQRALRVGLELAAAGERVHVVSMGPDAAGPVLEQAVALGAFQARHLCDRVFAGADVLATSRALAAELRRLRVGLIVAGDRSTDSETGLVGPEVAALLGVPSVTGARAVLRDPGGEELTVTVEAGERTRVVRVGLPAVVSVGEKIAKPLKLDPARGVPIAPSRLVRVTAAMLGVDPGLLGAAGSPTTVVSVDPAAQLRLPRTFGGPSAAEAVRQALEALEPLLQRGPVAPAALPRWGVPSSPYRLFLLASDEDGRLEEGVLGWCSRVRTALPGTLPTAVWIGPSPTGTETAALSRAGALAGIRLAAEPGAFDAEGAAETLGAIVRVEPVPVVVGVVSGSYGREVAGGLAAGGALGAVGDATDIVPGAPGAVRFLKPSFGGSSTATIESRTRPTVATLREGIHSSATDGEGPLSWTEASVPPPSCRVRSVGPRLPPVARAPPTPVEVVVAVGMGVGGPEGVAQARAAADVWGARLAGTRRVVDSGWLPTASQVGLTGTSLAPRLAVLLGVRGSSHHMIGWRRAERLLAVNADPAAPVFSDVDVGIVGRVEEVLPLLLEPVATLLGRRTATDRERSPPP